MVNDFKSKGSVGNCITERSGTISAPQQNINSCSHCAGATFETEQKPIRYSVNIALILREAKYRGSCYKMFLRVLSTSNKTFLDEDFNDIGGDLDWMMFMILCMNFV